MTGSGLKHRLIDLFARRRRSSGALERELANQRRVSADLEQAVAVRTAELEEAQRVLQRMWRLGQQITLELNPARVLERFLEAAIDIIPADGGAVAMTGDDGKLHIVAVAGIGEPMAGRIMPMSDSIAGDVVRTGRRFTVADVVALRDEAHAASVDAVAGLVKGFAIVPIARRGERIGVVMIGAREERLFDSTELDRVEAMADLLSLALDNAELVENLRQAEWRFRTLFRAAPDAVLTVLQSGRVREANDAVREVTGFEPLQVVGRLIDDLVLESDREKLRGALAAAFAGRGGPARVEVSMRHSSGPARFVELAMNRLPQADPPSVLLVGRDMTVEREMRQRLMESDRLAVVGELVAGVAHEVNNPLSSISAFSQLLLRDESLTASQRESVEVIQSETMRASQVVKDLLAFARHSEPQREPTDLDAVVARTMRLRSYQLTSNRIQLEQSLAEDLPAVMGDARQLQQVCLNLVTNAIQAMAPMGGGTLTVSTRAEGDEVIVEVGDTGPGIADQVRAHIFEPFFTTKLEGEGTGLGLSASYGIVSAHGGRIEVVETSSAGTTFRVRLPVVRLENPGARQLDLDVAPVRSPLVGLRILVVDDEAALRSGLESYGALRGFRVVTACDGREALAKLEETTVDAVVCDLRMPSLDGVAFHERLRRERPGLAARTVFLSGDVVNVGRPAPSRQPVIAKPFAFGELEQAIAAVMRGVPFRASA